jgi:hypothetical protein
MNLNKFQDLQRAGLSPIPIVWDEKNKNAIKYVEHGMIHAGSNPDEVINLWLNEINECNGIALKLFPPFYMVDFDLKNTDDKTIYDQWIKAVTSVLDDFTSKVCIEKTRNGGYHVYCKFRGIIQKQTLAKSETGNEVIANYTGGLLSFCEPTPGYEVIHGSFDEIYELTQDEFDMVNAISLSFNKHVDTYNYENHIVIDYPIEYESIALHFDRFCNEKAFEYLLNSIDLYEVKKSQRSKDKHLKYLRKGSKADYSAKVYFNSNKLLLFTSSIAGFPSFHSRINEHDHNWILTATKIVYYKCKCNWVETIEVIKRMAKEYNIEIESQKPMVFNTKPKTSNIEVLDITDHEDIEFPIDVLPKNYQTYIIEASKSLSFSKDYLACTMLSTIATSIGNSLKIQVKEDYLDSPIFWFAIVGSRGASKSHPVKKVLTPLNKIDDENFKNYSIEISNFNKLSKDDKEKNKKPLFKQKIVTDFTIEALCQVIDFNKKGVLLYKDELQGVINDFNKYNKKGSDEEFILESFNCGSFTINRKTQDTIRLNNIFINIIGTIQDEVLTRLASNHTDNGLLDRFLFSKSEKLAKPLTKYSMDKRYMEWWDEKVKQIDASLSYIDAKDIKIVQTSEWALDYFLEIEMKDTMIQNNDDTLPALQKYYAKLRTYVKRFALLICAIEMFDYGTELVIEKEHVEKAEKLIQYFANTAKGVFVENALTNEKNEVFDKMKGKTSTEKIISLSEKGFKNTEIAKMVGKSKQFIGKVLKSVC